MSNDIAIIAALTRMKLQRNICDFVPVMILSNSMYPTLVRGQMVHVYPINNEISVGDIVLYKHWEKSLTIHRIVSFDTGENNKKRLYTKGDHNDYIDPYLITEDDVIGVVKIP